jgi:hypothetical protein
LITCALIEEPALEWEYTPDPAAPRSPTGYKVYRREAGGTIPVLYHTNTTPRQSAPLSVLDCHATTFYSVSAVVDSDPVSGEEIQSPLSEELEVRLPCVSLEVTLETLWVYGVNDGDPCTIFDDCRNDYEAYGWMEFNGHRIRWNDHCDSGLFSGCIYVPPSYSRVLEASEHNWSAYMLNVGAGWHRHNNVVHIPIEPGEALGMMWTLMDHDSASPDTSWCGATGRTRIVAEARPASEWQTFDEVLQVDDGNCIIRFRVRGAP